MKKMLFVILLLILASCTMNKNVVQEKEINLNKTGFQSALESKNTGLVEDAIFQIILCELNGVKLKSESLVKTLENLTFNGATEKIKTKAELALKYIRQNNSVLTPAIKSRFYEKEKMFNILEELLEDNQSNKDMIFVNK